MEAYETISTIGQGNYGTCLLVRNKRDKLLYAMKRIPLGKKEESQAALREAQVLSTLWHPNVITYKESFLHEKALCIVTSYCEEGDLFTRIKDARDNNEPFSQEQIVEWFIQIAMALDYIHSKKVLHRDLKTQNIFLSRGGLIKLGDFGISKVMEGTEDFATTVTGTPYYMAPEVCTNQPYTYKSDVWSLGCVVYELCTLRHAFSAESLMGLLYQIVQGTFPPIPEERYESGLRSIVHSMLARDCRGRPSAADVLSEPWLKTRGGTVRTDKMRLLKSKSLGRSGVWHSRHGLPPSRPSSAAGPSLPEAEARPLSPYGVSDTPSDWLVTMGAPPVATAARSSSSTRRSQQQPQPQPQPQQQQQQQRQRQPWPAPLPPRPSPVPPADSWEETGPPSHWLEETAQFVAVGGDEGPLQRSPPPGVRATWDEFNGTMPQQASPPVQPRGGDVPVAGRVSFASKPLPYAFADHTAAASAVEECTWGSSLGGTVLMQSVAVGAPGLGVAGTAARSPEKDDGGNSSGATTLAEARAELARSLGGVSLRGSQFRSHPRPPPGAAAASAAAAQSALTLTASSVGTLAVDEDDYKRRFSTGAAEDEVEAEVVEERPSPSPQMVRTGAAAAVASDDEYESDFEDYESDFEELEEEEGAASTSGVGGARGSGTAGRHSGAEREMMSMFKHMGAQLDKTLSVSGDTMELAPIQDEVIPGCRERKLAATRAQCVAALGLPTFDRVYAYLKHARMAVQEDETEVRAALLEMTGEDKQRMNACFQVDMLVYDEMLLAH